MDRINSIINHHVFTESCEKIEILEQKRAFCHHDISHFLDTARVAWIYVMENNIDISKEVVYATALLHDIGRWQEYENGIPHDTASAALAKCILKDSRFTSEEILEITAAIFDHRNPKTYSILGKVLYIADKKSRLCFSCKAYSKCNWSKEKKNTMLFL